MGPVKVLRMGAYPGLSGGPNVVTRVRMRGRQEGGSEGRCGQGQSQAETGRWGRGPEHRPGAGSFRKLGQARPRSPSRVSRGTQPCPRLDCSPARPVLDFWPLELEEKKCVLLPSLSLWLFVTAARQPRGGTQGYGPRTACGTWAFSNVALFVF